MSNCPVLTEKKKKLDDAFQTKESALKVILDRRARNKATWPDYESAVKSYESAVSNYSDYESAVKSHETWLGERYHNKHLVRPYTYDYSADWNRPSVIVYKWLLQDYGKKYSLYDQAKKEYEVALQECNQKQQQLIVEQTHSTNVAAGTGTSAGLSGGVILGTYLGPTIKKAFATLTSMLFPVKVV